MSNTTPTVYLLETLVTFQHRYLIEAASPEEAAEQLEKNETAEQIRDEWQQKYLGEVIITNVPVTNDMIVELSNRSNPTSDSPSFQSVERFIWKRDQHL